MSHASTGSIAAQSAAYAAGSNGSLQLVARAFAWVAERRRVNRTVAALADLSDRTLADIGIERSEIERIARYGRNLSNSGL
jgi:uncharacterized protein YjiS (DUF1127 family)